ncbi:17465_t:CDS:2 [Entrophospora sp. SA101]|nr:17465_t:CDS:2 [Entrophospora sp. SA101]
MGGWGFEVSIDSWTSPLGQSIYAFVIITPARCQFIYSINDFSSDRHTAQFNEEQLLRIIDNIGKEKIAAIVSDADGSKKKDYWAKKTLKKCQKIVSFFHKSHCAGAALHEEIINSLVFGGNLKSSVKTHWSTSWDVVEEQPEIFVNTNAIKVLPILPNDPGELSVEWKRIFPIKKYSMLKELRNVREKLRVEYFFSGKLPDTYFNFPKPRELLPFSPKGLPNYLAQYLPFNSNRTEKTLREIVQELREYYIFKKLPNNYFTPKPRLPNSPDNTIFNYIFPITEQNTANEFIKEARRKYEIIFPINKKWINVPKTKINLFFLKTSMNWMHNSLIPDEWISIEKTNDNIDTPALEISNIERKQLPDLTTTTQELDKIQYKNYNTHHR